MLRTAVLCTIRGVARQRGTHASLKSSYQYSLRFESSKANDDALKKARELHNDMKRDWDAPVLTYEQVKPKTKSPSIVRLNSFT